MANIKEKTEALNKALEAISEEEMQEVAGGLSKGGKIALATASSIIGVGAATMIGLGAAGRQQVVATVAEVLHKTQGQPVKADNIVSFRRIGQRETVAMQVFQCGLPVNVHHRVGAAVEIQTQRPV